MNARSRILQSLRHNTCTGKQSAQVRLVPARRITRNVVDEFVIQAELSGARVVELNSEEWSSRTSSYLGEGATVVHASLAIAETGSVALRSIESPSANSYLCDHLVVCVKKDTVVPYINDGLVKLATNSSRALHLMTGPSRTADVEQTIQIGAHGPRQLTIVLYGDLSSHSVC